MAENDMTVVKAENLSFKYRDSVEGISNINFSIKKGEVVLLTGNSGSGKSTLLKCLNGLIPAITEGELKGLLAIEGNDYSKIKMHQLNTHIGSVFQNPRSQFFTDNTTAELVFPMENYGFTKEEMDKRTGELCQEFGLEELMDRNIFSLSSGERQMLALASSMALRQKLLLFDEPSANLDYGNSMKLGKIIYKLKKEGYTVIVADHRFYYLSGMIDKVLFMEKGSLSVCNSEEEFRNGNYDTRSFDIFSIDIPFEKRNVSDKVVGELRNASFKHILHDVNLTINKGEIAVLIGNNGAGKTTLAKLLCKSLKPDSGEVKTDGLPFFIMQDPDYQLFGTSVVNEMTLVSNSPEKINEITDYLGLGPYINKHPFDLSGGQKQRLQIGMAMLCGRNIIIFDEPTSGLDVYSMQRVSKEIKKLKDNAGIIVISHDYEFIRHIADRIIFLDEGRIKEDFILKEDTLFRLNEIFKKMQEDI